MYIESIQPGNEALKFIDRRLLDDKYRGDESSQHNRYDMAEVFNILSILNKFAPQKNLIRIRDTDLSKRPENTSDEIPYALFCDEVKKVVGKGTQDSIRKNLFVDFHRMGLIERYNNNRDKLDAFSGAGVKYVSLTDDGIKFVNSTLLNRAFMFTKALDKLLGGYIEISLDLLKDDEYKIGKITKWEFMFFVSAIDSNTDFRIDTYECVQLIKSYRILSSMQKKAVIETLKQKLQPKNFYGNKTNERDWHNWQNKIDQVFHLFKQTPYFDISGDEKQFLSLSSKKIMTKDGKIVDVYKRSISEKYAYFKEHKVKKTEGYELHHVVPLSWSESPEQYKLLDVWQNMVYIDAYSHAKITQNKNRNIFMSAHNDDIILSDKNNNRVFLIANACILYDRNKQGLMLDCNKKLRTTVF